MVDCDLVKIERKGKRYFLKRLRSKPIHFKVLKNGYVHLDIPATDYKKIVLAFPLGFIGWD